ncbi:TPR_9 domain-containing protein [Cephalotus follicularis]|uniref:TPR_9 domain-containing protein n=1 Tax=Cephalotus follicularis TaxID=3775 RepID=A0A1Q3B4E6_CEPFO|nr:TPR_9 domain-containing protein [Cephalotus follicularis]
MACLKQPGCWPALNIGFSRVFELSLPAANLSVKGFSTLTAEMESLHYCHQPLHLSLNHQYRPSFPNSLSSLSFRTPLPSSQPFKFPSIKAVSPSIPPPHRPNPSLLQTLTPLLKSTCITIAAALLSMRLHHTTTTPPLALAATSTSTVDPTTTTQTESIENLPLEDQERILENTLSRDPDDTEALRSLMEVKIKSRKLDEAIDVINRLISLEPDEIEWPILKAQCYSYSGEFEIAKKEFEEILDKDPLRVEAYHGLVMAYAESGDALKDIEKRIELAMRKCLKEKNKSDFRDFKLLIAQIRVMEGKHGEALRVYEELVKEEPRDFRPYLCQGIIYTLLKKKDEAEMQFDKFRKLVPKNHPYREYFVDNMVATKLFSEKAERETS